MGRALQIAAALAFILLGPADAIADAVCWWSMGCNVGVRCQSLDKS